MSSAATTSTGRPRSPSSASTSAASRYGWIDAVPVMEQALQAGHRLGWVLGDRGGETERLLLRGGGGCDLVHEPPSQRLVGAHVLRRQQQVLGHREAAQGDQPGGPHGNAER